MDTSKPRILFIHENFPAQFGALAIWLAEQGWDVKFATARSGVKHNQIGIINFEAHRPVTKDIHHYITGYESAIINAQAFARVAVRLRKEGYRPHIVVAHSGWGVGSLAKDVWPDTIYVPYFEWYYSWPAKDRTKYDVVGDSLDGSAKARIRNSPIWLDISSADAGICPTLFQLEQFPKLYQDQITVLPDGVDTDLHCPGSRDADSLNRLKIPHDADIVTYIARGMEPLRGFPEMMKVIAQLQKTRPNIHTIVVGTDRIAYGQKPEFGSWKKHLINTLDLDLKRIHFVGHVPRLEMIRILQASTVHLYFTVPFVLSWSALDAMSCGCVIVANDAEPVKEFMRHNETALLSRLDEVDSIVATVERVLNEQQKTAEIGKNARRFVVENLDAKAIAFPKKKAFFERLLS